MNKYTITDSFNKYFYVIPANSAPLREIVYRIRYQVYCREFHYEREEDCPGQMEQDDYDAQAQHCLLVHRPSNAPVGCLRLIGPQKDDPSTPLPFQRYCKNSLSYDSFDLGALPQDSFGEVSRLAVLAAFRRRQTDEKKPITLPGEDIHSAVDGRHSFPFIPVSLFLAGLSLFLTSNLHCAFAMMEPRLARLLKRFGIIFIQIGDVVDYHGFRGPFMYPREGALANLTPEVQALLQLIDQQLTEGRTDAIAINKLQ